MQKYLVLVLKTTQRNYSYDFSNITGTYKILTLSVFKPYKQILWTIGRSSFAPPRPNFFPDQFSDFFKVRVGMKVLSESFPMSQ